MAQKQIYMVSVSLGTLISLIVSVLYAMWVAHVLSFLVEYKLDKVHQSASGPMVNI